MTRRATFRRVTQDSATPLLEIEAVIVAHITVRRAAVASLVVAGPKPIPYTRYKYQRRERG